MMWLVAVCAFAPIAVLALLLRYGPKPPTDYYDQPDAYQRAMREWHDA